MDDVKLIVKESIKEYNRYRSPEAIARLVTRKGDTYYVKFDGSYCETCGLYDWIDDLRYVMLEKGLNVEIEKLKEPEGPEGSVRVAAFRVKQLRASQRP
ncbi:hypothetical protein ASAC_0960 [Acidilobus saccharovorans 345-15]|uniref:Uncharacterized protein n=1 Tax=Acidilobus saccharovorans (strain DSM 16705 / JCM 18335 / VKM B-2471 / 345-15) TaxID=666510 RepID=D9Q227_ACIS3|nr:hypothetical protein [Acidilobus saccharovorans]ADL19365.1 hypothetical protein ASAC_0960 [Acidilobus saccharovorans 345-15]